MQVWWQIDPKAEMLYGLSPYNSMANNPIIYNDPNGDFIHIVIGAAIGGVGNLIYQAATGNIQSLGDGLVAFGIGAGAGALGAATGGASLAAMGTASGVGGAIAAGATAGFSGGAAAGFVQGAGNSLYFQNGDLNDILNAGIEGAFYGGVSGAVLGGIGGGIGHAINKATPSVNNSADDVFKVTNSEGVEIIAEPALPSAKQPIGGIDLATARETGLYTGPFHNITPATSATQLSQQIQSVYINLVQQATQRFGGNVTVMRNGRDLFRVHQPSSGHGLKVTPINENIAPNGKVFLNAGKDIPVNQTHINQLRKALDGSDGFLLRTRGGK